MKYLFLYCLSALLFFPKSLSAQTLIVVTKIPAETPTEDSLFASGDFNTWNPHDTAFLLKPNKSRSEWTCVLPKGNHEYKITRGSWKTVEGNANGIVRTNRIVKRSKEEITIESWEDTHQFIFVLKSIPTNTPEDATIYLAGNFNGWNPKSPKHRFQKNKDGTYSIQLSLTNDPIEYKITRGSWRTVEGRKNGKASLNRILYQKASTNHNVEIDIPTWEDLAYPFSLFDLILAFSAFQGILLILALLTLQVNNTSANKLLVGLIAVTSVAMIARVTVNYREFFQNYPQIILLPELVLFLYAPLFYFYIQKLLTVTDNTLKKWFHFFPLGIVLIAYAPYFFLEKQVLIDKIVARELSMTFAMVGFLALLGNLYYWWVCRKMVAAYKTQYDTTHSTEQNLQYLNTAIFIKGACLVLWVGVVLIFVLGYVLKYDVLSYVEHGTDGIWLVFSVIPYFMGYFAIQQPEIFRILPEIDFFSPRQVPSQDTLQPSETSRELSETNKVFRDKLENFMVKQKPYENPRLTINDLAEGLKIQPHLLSKIINEAFGMNFFDYVNSHRIEAFKKIAASPSSKNLTLLGIAFDVGFNSKSAFNRSFKKLTNSTPSEFYQEFR